MHTFFQDEFNRYQQAAATADHDQQNEALYGYPWPNVQITYDTEEASEVSEQYPSTDSFYVRNREAAEQALKALDASDYIVVLRYLEGRLAQTHAGDHRTPEDIQRMRVLERQIYQYLHPEVQPGAPSLEEMEAFFQTEQDQENQHNRREAESGLFSNRVVAVRKAYAEGDVSPTLQLIESSLAEMAEHVENPPQNFLEVTEDQSEKESTGPIWEVAPARYAEDLRGLWVRLVAESTNTL